MSGSRFGGFFSIARKVKLCESPRKPGGLPSINQNELSTSEALSGATSLDKNFYGSQREPNAKDGLLRRLRTISDFPEFVKKNCGELIPARRLAIRSYLANSERALNGVYRFLRLAFLGLFIIAVIEALLRVLKWLGFPVASFEDITRYVTESSRTRDNESLKEKGTSLVQAIGASKLLSTALVSGVASSAVLVPEIGLQTATAIKSSDRYVENIQKEFDRERSALINSSLQNRLLVFANSDIRTTIKETIKEVPLVSPDIAAIRKDVTQTKDRIENISNEIGGLSKQGQITQIYASDATTVSKSVREKLSTLESNVLKKLTASEGKIQESISAAQTVMSDRLDNTTERVRQQLTDTDRGAKKREEAIIRYHKEVEEKPWYDMFTTDFKARKRTLDTGLDTQ